MKKLPVTQATRFLRSAKAQYTDHLYDYEEKGGTAVSARELGVPEHNVIKTLIFEDDKGRPLVVLMQGDMQVSARGLARTIGARSTQVCLPEVAEKHSGYRVGGTSPFGLKIPLPIFAQTTIQQMDRLYINGGARGYLVALVPAELARLVSPTWVEVSRD